MTQEDLDKIRDIARGHQSTLSPQAWQRLDGKLRARKDKKKIVSYRNMSVAAILVALLSVTAVFSMYLKDHNPARFATNEQFVPLIIEDLDVSNGDAYYTIESISQLKRAYEKAKKLDFDQWW